MPTIFERHEEKNISFPENNIEAFALDTYKHLTFHPDPNKHPNLKVFFWFVLGI